MACLEMYNMLHQWKPKSVLLLHAYCSSRGTELLLLLLTACTCKGAGAVSSPDPFTGLVPGLAGALPSMPVSRQTSVSSTHSAQDLPSHQAWSASPAVSQSFGGQHAPQQTGQTASMAFSDPFAGSSYGADPGEGQFAAAASRARPKSSGNPFA